MLDDKDQAVGGGVNVGIVDLVRITRSDDLGALPYYAFQGQYRSLDLTDAVKRHYKHLHVDYHVSEHISPVYSELSFNFYDGDAQLTLNQRIQLTAASTTSNILALPVSLITDRLSVEVTLSSFTPNSSPVIDGLMITW